MISVTVPKEEPAASTLSWLSGAVSNFSKQDAANGKGILLITGHLGAWELGGMVLASDGFPVNVVTMAEPTQELNEWRQKYRAALRDQDDHRRL